MQTRGMAEEMIMVRRVYMPKPGEGGKLLRVVRQIKEETVNAGFPPLTIYTQTHGPHGMVVTEQEWESLEAYEESRDGVRQTPAITGTFGEAYPLLAETHVTEIYRQVG